MLRINTSAASDLSLVMLHGYAMDAGDLEPFARSLGVDARFFFPRGLHALDTGGRAWWRRDDAAVARRLNEEGPRDLADEYPPERAAARTRLCEVLRDPDVGGEGRKVVLAGFSQGGMLACDTLLQEPVAVDALVLLSSSRVAIGEWRDHLPRLRGLPVMVAHGRSDADLSFQAGERLRDCLHGAGARVTWVPFDGGHQIPLPVWRELRKFVKSLANAGPRDGIKPAFQGGGTPG